MSASADGIPFGPIDREPLDYPTPGVFPLAPQREEILRDVLQTSGVELGAYDERIARWFAETADWSTLAVVTSWVARAAASREKSSRMPADATPDQMASRERRLAQLLDTIRSRPWKWTTGLVQDIRRTTGGPVQRGTARRDLDELHSRGHLHKHGAGDGRYYTLRRREGNG